MRIAITSVFLWGTASLALLISNSAPFFTAPTDVQGLINRYGAALGAANVAVHAQGFALMGAAARDYGWPLDLAAVARAWRQGCIIRSGLMEIIADALAGNPAPLNLLRLPAVLREFEDRETAYRALMAELVLRPLPVMSSALAYVDGYRQSRSGANLTAAQRDVFGHHGFARIDKPGKFNAQWPIA